MTQTGRIEEKKVYGKAKDETKGDDAKPHHEARQFLGDFSSPLLSFWHIGAVS
ncbi:MAG: hypothetical protein MR519_06885 [Spirochaetaceae bacterium]|nr:hypothetical protein [Spirochaetaceae bacterium]